nr:13685_t:CDS:2 [Entrophospora candida]
MSNNQNETLRFCDWRIEIYGCFMSDMFSMEAITSLITYAILAIIGTATFIYRYKYTWKGLFINHYGGLRPLPVDNLLFFWTIACYLRGLHSLLMLLDVYTSYLQKEAVQEIGWTVLCYGAVTYIIGIIYTIPVNYSHSNNSENDDSNNLYKVRTIYIPSSKVLNILLCCWLLYPTLTCFPFAMLSGISRDNGNDKLADIWTMAQYIAYTFHDLLLSTVGIYYGINFILILNKSSEQFKSSPSSSASQSSTTRLEKTTTSYNYTNNNVSRVALDRLKYTMTYIAILPLIAAPWWFFFGVYRLKFISSAGLSNLFLSSMWHVTGIQPLMAVFQYIVVKGAYQHYKSNKPSKLKSSTTSTSLSSTLSPNNSDFSVDNDQIDQISENLEKYKTSKNYNNV